MDMDSFLSQHNKGDSSYNLEKNPFDLLFDNVDLDGCLSQGRLFFLPATLMSSLLFSGRKSTFS